MATGHGLDARWGTGVYCNKCGEELIARPTILKEKYVRYGYIDPGCGTEGDWETLARGYFEAKRREEYGSPKKAAVVKREF